MEDPQLQKEFLDKLLKSFEEKPVQNPSILLSVGKNTYNLMAILSRKKTPKQSTISVQSLQEEIKTIKVKLKQLKEKQAQDSEAIQLLLSKQTKEESEEDKESVNPITIRNKTLEWEILDGRKIQSEHPPLKKTKIPHLD